MLSRIALVILLSCSLDPGRRAPAAAWTQRSNPSCVAPPRPRANARLARAYPNAQFDQPVTIATSRDHAWWYVGERRGRVWRVATNDETATPELVLDVSERVNASSSSIGLLAVALDPSDASPAIFISYTGHGGTIATSRISRFVSRDAGRTFEPADEQVLLEIDQVSDYHVNGDLRFGPDGFLYAGFGDGGPQGDPTGRAQDPYSLKGKILRLDVHGKRSYQIPPDNPYARGGGRPEVWALGLRNPWRFGFDRETGALWVGDVGADRFDEIDQVVRGGNYGWNVREGAACASAAPCAGQGLIDPVIVLAHPEVTSITFGVSYRGAALRGLQGHLIYADYASGAVWEVDPGQRAPRMLDTSGHAIVSFVEDLAGEPVLVDLGGTLWRLVPGGDGPLDMPALLSATGCFAPGGNPAPGLIPYEVNVPFWSDGANKRRWFAIPDGTKLHVAQDGHVELPIGSVVAKEFGFAGVRFETRLFVRHDDGPWAGYTYRWDAAGRDATLISSSALGVTTTSPTRWYFPHRGECLRCHQPAAGTTLGLELAQLRRSVDGDSGPIDQLAQFERMGLFDDALPAGAALPDERAGVGPQARAWLHANCAYCHRPGATGQGDLDLRFSTPLEQTGLCEVAREGTFGLDVSRRIEPGDPARSMLSRRIHATGFIRMPPIGSFGGDPRGIAVVDEWIRTELPCRRSGSR